MITLTSLQRDFLDRYYVECMNGEVGYAYGRSSVHGFTYDHMMLLWDSYVHSWGDDWGNWGDSHLPPLSPPPDPPIFPWSSIQELEAQLKDEKAVIERAKQATVALAPAS
jgi:hypothetical protein